MSRSHPAPLPLFALPGVVLFPQVYLPLHVFEPRYRALVRDAAAADGRIGIIAYDLSEGDDFDAQDRLMDIGTVGVMEELQTLPDGRYNIVLRGLQRFALDSLVPGQPYRLGAIQLLDDSAGLSRPEALEELPRLLRMLTWLHPDLERVFSELVQRQRPEQAFMTLTHNLISLLNLDFPNTQSLLELDTAAARLEAVIGVLEDHLTASRLMQELGKRREWLEQQNPHLN